MRDHRVCILKIIITVYLYHLIYVQILKLIQKKISSCQPSDEKSYTEKYQKHTACGFGYKVVCHYDQKHSRDLVIYRGEDCIQKFIKCMFDEVKNCQKVIREHFNKPLIMTNRDQRAFSKMLNDAIFV